MACTGPVQAVVALPGNQGSILVSTIFSALRRSCGDCDGARRSQVGIDDALFGPPIDSEVEWPPAQSRGTGVGRTDHGRTPDAAAGL